MNILTHNWNNFVIRQRMDGYVCLTDMARAHEKRPGDYLDLPKTQEYIQALSVHLKVLPDNLVILFRGNRSDGLSGTWAYRDIAIDFASWLSIPFRIWANETLFHVIESNAVDATQALLLKDLGLPEDFYEASFYNKTLMIKRLSEVYLRSSKIAPNPVLDGLFQMTLVQMFESIGIKADQISQTHLDVAKALDRVQHQVKALPDDLKKRLLDDEAVLRGIALQHEDRLIYYPDLRKVPPFSNRFSYPTKKLDAFLYACVARELILPIHNHDNLSVVKWIAG